ncbi:MAG: hypothetical protein M3Y77_18825 [Actinomycetota bacterium]|nr:hypothetical protein [Actinomycetota bacterium]
MTRRRWILAALGVVLVIGVAVLAGFYLYFAQKPPAFVAVPDIYRVSPPAGTDGRNVNYPPNITIDGTPVLVQTDGVDTVQGRLEARMFVRVGALQGDLATQSAGGSYAKGAKIHVGGVTVEILDLWDEPSSENDAVDVRVTKP